MKIAITGSTGLVGSSLTARLRASGHDLIRLQRRPPEVGSPLAPGSFWLNSAELEGAEAVIHLAGKSIASNRWSRAAKIEIRDSRVRTTRELSETLATLDRPPRVFLVASAIGIYGNRGEEILTEESSPGSGFLPMTCQEWERAAQPARDRGIRTCHLRFGMILSAKGGALAPMLIPFKLGLGGRIGSGAQFWSWITLPDAVEVMVWLIDRTDVSGPVNAVSPVPVRNREFTRDFARALARPAITPVPAFLARWLFGEMADPLLLASARVEPAQLLSKGYAFRNPELPGALRALLHDRC